MALVLLCLALALVVVWDKKPINVTKPINKTIFFLLP
jgi:hypothetical protein